MQVQILIPHSPHACDRFTFLSDNSAIMNHTPLRSPIVGGFMLRSSARLSPWVCLLMAFALLSPPVSGQKPMPSSQAHAAGSTLAERVGSPGFIQLEAESFKQLTPKQQVLAYWLSQASIAIDPMIYDQMSRFGL